MTVVDTAGPRLALLLRDASDHVESAEQYFQEDFDVSKRPGWAIFEEAGEYQMQGASESADFQETYRLELFGMPHDTLRRFEAEQQAREIIRDTVQYLMGHARLQFSNNRGLADSRLPALRYVKSVKVRRGPVGLMVMPGQGESGAFYGCKLTMTITGAFSFDEAII